MILKALYDYYDRCGEDIPPVGWQEMEISFEIIIDSNGVFKKLNDMRTDDLRGMTLCVTHESGRSSNVVGNILWDKMKYILGIEKKGKEYAEEKTAFVKECQALAEKLPNNKDLQAILLFYKNGQEKQVQNDELWENWSKMTDTSYATFRIEGSPKLVIEDEDLIEVVKSNYISKADGNEVAVCLITGKKLPVVKTTTRTPLPGGDSMGKLVSFNLSSFMSYGKEQGYNAPISAEAEGKYTAALNKLLKEGSHNRIVIQNKKGKSNKKKQGVRAFVFWSEKQDALGKDLEEMTYNCIALSAPDDPNKNIEAIKKTFDDIFSGNRPSDCNDRFFFLGLAQYRTRISVVYWNVCSLKEFAEKIINHFNDMEIVGGNPDKPYAGLYNMLAATTIENDADDAQPNLIEMTLKSIIQGTPYPFSLYTKCLQRVKATKKAKKTKDDNDDEITKKAKSIPSITKTQAAIIKAYLNRLNNNNNNKFKVLLDKENQNQGYLCGRLFAVIDKIQEDANSIHSIRERYMNSASATPSTVFATILNLSTHHIEKLNVSGQVFYEKLKQEIISKLDSCGFPTHLDLQDQGRFFVGYYHQRQDLFTSKENKETEE